MQFMVLEQSVVPYNTVPRTFLTFPTQPFRSKVEKDSFWDRLSQKLQETWHDGVRVYRLFKSNLKCTSVGYTVPGDDNCGNG